VRDMYSIFLLDTQSYAATYSKFKSTMTQSKNNSNSNLKVYNTSYNVPEANTESQIANIYVASKQGLTLIALSEFGINPEASQLQEDITTCSNLTEQHYETVQTVSEILFNTDSIFTGTQLSVPLVLASIISIGGMVIIGGCGPKDILVLKPLITPIPDISERIKPLITPILDPSELIKPLVTPILDVRELIKPLITPALTILGPTIFTMEVAKGAAKKVTKAAPRTKPSVAVPIRTNHGVPHNPVPAIPKVKPREVPVRATAIPSCNAPVESFAKELSKSAIKNVVKGGAFGVGVGLGINAAISSDKVVAKGKEIVSAIVPAGLDHIAAHPEKVSAISDAALNSPTGKAAVKEHAKIAGKEAGTAVLTTAVN